MQPEDGACIQFADTRADIATWDLVPRSFVRLTHDNVLSPALVTKMIADADKLAPDNPFDVRTLAAGHIDVALRAEELAALLADLT